MNNHKYLYKVYFANETYNLEKYTVVYENKNFVVIVLKSKNDIAKIERHKIKEEFKCDDSDLVFDTSYCKYFFNVDNFDIDKVIKFSKRYSIKHELELAENIMNNNLARYNDSVKKYNKLKSYYDDMIKNEEGK